MSIGNLILVVSSVTVSYLICYNGLLQNATDVITKCDRSLLQNASVFLLQNVTVITNCDNFITKYDSYYKMQRLLQIATVHLSQQSGLASLFLMKACMCITRDWEASIKL